MASNSSFYNQNTTVYTDTNPAAPADAPVSNDDTAAPSSFFKGTGGTSPEVLLAGVPEFVPIAHNFLTGITANGVWLYAQPAASDIIFDQARFISFAGFDPSANVNGQIVLAGSYGGGLVLQDGSTAGGVWTDNNGDRINIGASGTSGGFASYLRFNPSSSSATLEMVSPGAQTLKLVGSDTGLDLSNGTQVLRMASDGHMQFSSQTDTFDFKDAAFGDGSTVSMGALSVDYIFANGDNTIVIDGGSSPSAGGDAISFRKDRDATLARRYTFGDVGGLTGDAGGGAFWRGLQLGGPSITDPVGGATLFPRLSFFAEYDTLTAPGTRNWVIEMGNESSTARHWFHLRGNNSEILVASSAASGVNYLTIANNPTGAGPVLASAGADTDVDLLYYTQGLGRHWFNSGEDTGILRLTPVTSAVNYLEITSAVTADKPTIAAIGSDANISVHLDAKGTGNLRLQGGCDDPGDSVDTIRVQTLAVGVTPGADFGGGISFYNHNAASSLAYAASIDATWANATAGAEVGVLTLDVGGVGHCKFAATDDGLGLLLGNNVNSSYNSMFGYTPGLLLHASQAFYQWSADTSARGIYFNKSRGATPGDWTVVNEGDALGTITFGGADGSVFQPSAQIAAFVDGSPSGGNVPGSLSFRITQEGGSNLVERLRIYTPGQVLFPGAGAQQIIISTSNDSYGGGISADCGLRTGTDYTFHIEGTGDLALEADTDTSGAANILFMNSHVEIARFDSSNRLGIGRSPSNAMLDVNGAIATRESSIVTGVTTYTVADTDSALVFNCAATCTITLPAASSCPGRWLHLKTIAAFTVVSASSNVCPATTNTPGTAILTAVAGRYAVLQSNGTNWVKMFGGTGA